MKKIITTLLAIFMLSINMAGCNISNNENVNKPKEQTEQNSNIDTKKDEEKDNTVNTMILSDENTEIEITGVEVTKDYDGNDALIVKYNYTNKQDEPNSALMNVYMEAFQNGKQIESSAFLMNNEYNDQVDIMKGITQEDCWYTFSLVDMSEVTLFVQTDIIFGEKVEYTINLQDMNIVRK